jgi:DNA-binding HxlR family transcriptional regulator
MPLRSDYADQDCSLARTLELVGERWTLLIVRDAFHGLTRYEEFLRSLGMATNVLSSRLQKLVAAGILDQEEPRGPYSLTAKGRDLYPILLTLIRWGDTYEPGPDGPEVLILHRTCEHEAGAALTCEHCGEPLTPESLSLQPPPGTEGPDGKPTKLTPPQLAAWGTRAGD